MKNSGTMIFQKLVLERMTLRYQEMDNDEIAQWIGELPEIKAGVLEMLAGRLYGAVPDRLIRRYVNQVRRECTLMLDVLHSSPDCPPNLEQLHQEVLDCLVAILEQMDLRYKKYLDSDAVMPVMLYQKAAREIEEKTVVMVMAMTGYHADKSLQAVVVTRMTGLLKKGAGSWHQISYLKKLQHAILGLCIGRVFNITARLRKLLLDKNFNTTGFVAYCKSEFEAEFAGCYEFSEQYDCLSRYQQEFSALSDKRKVPDFEPRLPRIKQLMLLQFASELRRLNRKNKLAPQPAMVMPQQQQYRLPLSISVDVLAYFCRLLLKTGVVTATKSDLLLFVSRNFQTKGAGTADTSLKSLNNKCRQVVVNTGVTMKSILLKMLKELDGEFT